MLPSSDKRKVLQILGSTSTWKDLAEHWLRFQSTGNFEVQEQAKRMTAVKRWRGVDEIQQQ